MLEKKKQQHEIWLVDKLFLSNLLKYCSISHKRTNTNTGYRKKSEKCKD